MEFKKALLFLLLFISFSCEKKLDKNISKEVIFKNNKFKDELYSIYKKNNLTLLEKKISGFKNYNNNEQLGIYNLYTGYIFEHNGNKDSAQVYYEKSIINLKKTNLTRELVLALEKNSENYTYLGKFDKAISSRYKAIEILKPLNFKNKEIKYYDQISALGIDFYLSRNYKKANELINNALKNKIKNKESIASLNSTKAIILFYDKKYEESIKTAKNSLQIYTNLKDSLNQAHIYNTIGLAYTGLAYEKKVKWEISQYYLEKSLYLHLKLNDINNVSAVLLNISRCLIQRGEIDLAIEKTKKAIEIANKHKQLDNLRDAYKKLSELYVLKNQHKIALEYYKKSSKIKDTIFNLEKDKAIQELATKYETLEKDKKIIVLEKDKEISKQGNIIFIIFIIFLLIIGTILFAYFQVRNKKNKELIKTNKKLHESELEFLKIEMELNKKELDHFTNKLISKSRLIDEMENKLIEIDESKQISHLTQMRILTDEDWITFKNHFEKVYEGFIPYLKKKYNTLTPAELRLLLLIKLKIDSNEIASILGISLESVKKGRYRLKKKLALNEQDDLNKYIQNIITSLE